MRFPLVALALFGASCSHPGAVSVTGPAEPDPRAVVRDAKARCDAGSAPDCLRFADRAKLGLGMPPSLEQALAAYAFACGKGLAAGCAGASRAVEQSERTCAEGASPACGLAGYGYLEGLGVPRDAAKARALLDRGCRAGDRPACDRLLKLPPAFLR